MFLTGVAVKTHVAEEKSLESVMLSRLLIVFVGIFNRYVNLTGIGIVTSGDLRYQYYFKSRINSFCAGPSTKGL